MRDVEASGIFSDQAVTYSYTENSNGLSNQAQEIFNSAARILEALKREDPEPDYLPSKSQKKQVIESFNNKIKQLDPIKSQLSLNEVLSIPLQLRNALEDNSLN